MPMLSLLMNVFLDQMQCATAPGKLLAWAATDRVQRLLFIIGACLNIIGVLVRLVYFADLRRCTIGVNRPGPWLLILCADNSQCSGKPLGRLLTFRPGQSLLAQASEPTAKPRYTRPSFERQPRTHKRHRGYL